MATLVLNQPRSLNALSTLMLEELGQALGQIAEDDSIRAVVITGAGDKAFAAGADIANMRLFDPLAARRYAVLNSLVLSRMENLPQPILAAVRGYCLGGGCELAMAGDLIYASADAKFGHPELNLGVVSGSGGSQRLSRLVGKGWARELCLTGDIIDVASAKEIGLVNRVFPAEELMPAAMKAAEKIAGKGRVSTRACKELINFGFDLSLDHALHLEAEAFGMCFASPDQKEGMSAFLAKRKPEFKGGI